MHFQSMKFVINNRKVFWPPKLYFLCFSDALPSWTRLVQERTMETHLADGAFVRCVAVVGRLMFQNTCLEINNRNEEISKL